MDRLIYSVTIEENTIQLIINSLGYCVYIIVENHTDIFVNASLDESLAIMQSIMNQFI